MRRVNRTGFMIFYANVNIKFPQAKNGKPIQRKWKIADFFPINHLVPWNSFKWNCFILEPKGNDRYWFRQKSVRTGLSQRCEEASEKRWSKWSEKITAELSGGGYHKKHFDGTIRKWIYALCKCNLRLSSRPFHLLAMWERKETKRQRNKETKRHRNEWNFNKCGSIYAPWGPEGGEKHARTR